MCGVRVWQWVYFEGVCMCVLVCLWVGDSAKVLT